MSEANGERCPVCEVLEGKADTEFWTRHQYRLRKGEFEAHLAHGGSAPAEPLEAVEDSAVALVRAVLPDLCRGIRLAAQTHDRQALITIRQDLQEAIDAALDASRDEGAGDTPAVGDPPQIG